MTDDVDALAEALKAKGVEGTLARHTAEFACSLLAKAHERGPERPDPDSAAGMPGVERNSWLAERMPAYVRRAAVDCALSAGWVCIATLATVDPVRWRTICYALGFTEKQGQYLAFISPTRTCSDAPRPRPICNAISASARPRSIRWS